MPAPRHLLMLGLLVACGPKKKGATGAPGSDSGTTVDTGSPADTGEDSGDTGDTGDPAVPPWPTEGDGTVPGGAMDCSMMQSPCNHQVRLGVSGDGESWTILDGPLATRASVAHVVPVDWGEWEGEAWGGLWVTYVDVFPGNIPAEAAGTVDNVLTTATIAFPWSAVQTAEGLADVLSGNGPEPWVYRATDTWRFGEAIVDPERELIQTEDGLRHLLLVIDLDLETPPPDSNNHLYLLDSSDGFAFEMIDEVDIPDPGTDPDCFPEGFEGAYPGPLPEEWAPEGPGRWSCHVSGFNQFTPHEGSLLVQERSTEVVRGTTVTSTALRDGEWWAVGHVNPDEPRFPGHSDLTQVRRTEAGWSAPEPVLATGEVPGTEGGLQAPNRVVLQTGVELLVFHQLMSVPDGGAGAGAAAP